METLEKIYSKEIELMITTKENENNNEKQIIPAKIVQDKQVKKEK